MMKNRRNVVFIVGVVFVVLVVVVVGAQFIYLFVNSKCRFRLVNQSGEPLQDVRVIINWDIPALDIDRQFPSVAPGDEVVINVSRDWMLEVQYTLRGNTYTHTNGYVDLWTGETWFVAVNSDGSITEGYESRH